MKQERKYTASLPSNMKIGFWKLGTNVLMFLLNFGTINFYIGYNSAENFSLIIIKWKP